MKRRCAACRTFVRLPLGYLSAKQLREICEAILKAGGEAARPEHDRETLNAIRAELRIRTFTPREN